MFKRNYSFICLLIILLNFINFINCFYPSSYEDVNSSSTGIRFQNDSLFHYGKCDINGDGFDDMMFSVGTVGNVYSTVYVIFGPLSKHGQDLFNVDLNSMTSNGENGFKISINNYLRVKCGDLNNDGFDEIIIRQRAPTINSGGIVVIYGHSGKFENIGLNDINGDNGFIIEGYVNSDESLGTGCGLCDLNGDGIKDLIVSAFPGNYGVNGINSNPYIYILYGVNSGKYPTDVNGIFDRNLIINGSRGFYIDFLSKVISCIDLNRDGVDDIFFNSPGSSGIVVFGRKLPLSFSSPYLLSLDGEDGLSLSQRNEGSEEFLVDSGDFNGDGLVDFVFSFRNGRITVVYVLYGVNNSTIKFQSILDLDQYTNGILGIKFISETNPSSTDYLCESLQVTDIDNDGISDIICYKSSNNFIWGVYGSRSPYPPTTSIFPIDSPINDKCTGFKILDPRKVGFQTINFRNQSGPKDIIFTRQLSSSPSYTYLAFYGDQVRTFSDFSIINSELNFNQSSYNQSIPENYGISFLKNNYIEHIRMCNFIQSIKIKILNPSLGDSLILENLYPLDYNISNLSSQEILVSTLNKSSEYSILNITSNIQFFKDSTITTSTSTTIQISVINSDKIENIKLNLIRAPTDSSSSSSNNDSSEISNSSNENPSQSSSSNNNSSESSNSSSKSDSNVGVIVGSVLGSVVGLAILIFIILFLLKKKKLKSNSDDKKDIPLTTQQSTAQLFSGGKVLQIDKF